jgi:hypothetical protein
MELNTERTCSLIPLHICSLVSGLHGYIFSSRNTNVHIYNLVGLFFSYRIHFSKINILHIYFLLPVYLEIGARGSVLG